MRPLAEDTPLEVERIQMEILRWMSAVRKVDQVRDMGVAVAKMQEAAIRALS